MVYPQNDPGGFRKWDNMLRKLASLFTIRFSLVAMLVVLGGIIGYYTIGLTLDAIAKRDNARIAVDAGLIAENSLKAADALASEREYTVRALGIGSFMGVIDSALGEKALAYRAEAQQAMAAVVASAGGESVAGLAPHTTTRPAFSMSKNVLISMRPIVTWGAIMANDT